MILEIGFVTSQKSALEKLPSVLLGLIIPLPVVHLVSIGQS